MKDAFWDIWFQFGINAFVIIGSIFITWLGLWGWIKWQEHKMESKKEDL